MFRSRLLHRYARLVGLSVTPANEEWLHSGLCAIASYVYSPPSISSGNEQGRVSFELRRSFSYDRSVKAEQL